MSYYLILDEHGQPMRKVKTKHEADTLIKTYTDWSYRYVKENNRPDLSQLGEAPF